jgi:uncharacterized LabA/DUF88 family protein
MEPTHKRAALIVDGAYFEIGVNFFAKKTHIMLQWQLANVQYLLNSIQSICGVEFVSSKFITAENENSILVKKDFHNYLLSNNVEVDVREFKKEKEFCPNCKKHYDRVIQAEVDVAIAVAICEEVFYKTKDPVDAIVLIAGDRDFKDAIKSAIDKKEVEIILIGYENTMSYELKSLSGIRFLPILNNILADVFKPTQKVTSPKKSIDNWDIFGFTPIITAKPHNKSPRNSKKRIKIEKKKK